MSLHFYEVTLFGEFFAQDLKPIVNRITLHPKPSQQMHYHELMFKPIDAPQQQEQGNEPVLLRARKEIMSPDSKWYIPAFCIDIVGFEVLS
jgi:mediator of RNA polymerase II transcription subunit 18